MKYLENMCQTCYEVPGNDYITTPDLCMYTILLDDENYSAIFEYTDLFHVRIYWYINVEWF